MNKINQNWVFGNKAGLDFSTASATTPPTATLGFAIVQGTDPVVEGCASISDGNGNLLFYTDGVTVWDGSHSIKYSTLQGNKSSTQSSIIVPDPNNSNQYYILTTDGWTGSNKHFNGILLNIITWNAVLISTLMTMPTTAGFSAVEKLTAIQHENCRDFWVITVLQSGVAGNAHSGPGVFRVFRIDAGGITHIGDTIMNRAVADIGYLKGSPDGQMLALANGELANVLTYPFNNATGVINLSGLKIIAVPTLLPPPVSITGWWVYGVEFSPNSRILYFSLNYFNVTNGYLFQVDLTLTTSTAVQIGTIPLLPNPTPPLPPNQFAIGALQLGIDNRIYFARAGNVLGAILNPNILGTACNINNSYITLLTTTWCSLGLPNLLPNACEHDCDCDECAGCNKDAKVQNEELIVRAKTKFNVVKSKNTCVDPFTQNCVANAINTQINLEPCFYFHWGDGVNDVIEEHDTEVFHFTICNPFNDIQFNGLRITKITVVPNIHPIDKIQIIPDRFISYDCLPPCACQTREFAFITRANNTGGNYHFDVEYCYDNITIESGGGKSGRVQFPFVITED